MLCHYSTEYNACILIWHDTNRVLSTGGGRGEASPPNTPASPPQTFVTSSTFYIVVEVGPTLVSRTPQLSVTQCFSVTTMLIAMCICTSCQAVQ